MSNAACPPMLTSTRRRPGQGAKAGRGHGGCCERDAGRQEARGEARQLMSSCFCKGRQPVQVDRTERASGASWVVLGFPGACVCGLCTTSCCTLVPDQSLLAGCCCCKSCKRGLIMQDEAGAAAAELARHTACEAAQGHGRVGCTVRH